MREMITAWAWINCQTNQAGENSLFLMTGRDLSQGHGKTAKFRIVHITNLCIQSRPDQCLAFCLNYSPSFDQSRAPSLGQSRASGLMKSRAPCFMKSRASELFETRPIDHVFIARWWSIAMCSPGPDRLPKSRRASGPALSSSSFNKSLINQVLVFLTNWWILPSGGRVCCQQCFFMFFFVECSQNCKV